MKVIIAAFFSVFLTFPVFAQSIKKEFTNELHNYQETNWTIALGYGRSSTKLAHNENSNISGFNSFDQETHVPVDAFSLVAMREIFYQSRFSVNLIAKAGISTGSDEGKREGSPYAEKNSGNHFGGGLSLNYNMTAFHMKLQPYLGLNYIFEQSSYTLDHKNPTDGSALQTQHQYDASLLESSLGIRFLDPSVGLMSFFAIGHLQPLGGSAVASAKSNGTEFDQGIDASDIQRASIGFMAGFGVIF